jgi:archaellum component FlaF (FlaF/FlaG flagellin family)
MHIVASRDEKSRQTLKKARTIMSSFDTTPQSKPPVKGRMYKRLSIVVGALALTGAVAATAFAVTVDSGGAELQVDKRTSTTASALVDGANANEWYDLPGASVSVTVPANGSRLYDVPFFAESQCVGPGVGVCAVRIVSVKDPAGPPTEMNPAAGLNYAFDSDMMANNDDLREGHGMERSARLTGGVADTTYTIKVQYAVTNAATMFTLDDWHLAVHTNV